MNATSINLNEEDIENEPVNEDNNQKRRLHPPDYSNNQNNGSDEAEVELKVHRVPKPTNDTELTPTTSWYAKCETKPSHLPVGLWRCLSHLLGVVDGSKPIVGTTLHIFTVILAILFIVLHSWFEVYNILSVETRQTTLKGFVSIFLALYWATLGVYSHNLAGRLLAAPAIAQSVRLHTKTIFKLNSAAVLVILATTGLCVNLFGGKSERTFTNCTTVNLPGELCSALFYARCIYGIVSLLWNVLIASIILSVCRTLTLGLYLLEYQSYYIRYIH